MKKIVLILSMLMLVSVFAVAVYAEGALNYAESAPGGVVNNVDELIAAFGKNSYGEPNAELLPGKTNEIRLKNSIILTGTIDIRAGEYVIVGGGCIIAKDKTMSEPAFKLSNAELSFERTVDDSVTFDIGMDANITFDGRSAESGAFIHVSENAILSLNARVLVKDIVSTENGGFIYSDTTSEGSEIRIYASRFENCKAKNGGAVYVSGEKSQGCFLIVKRSTFNYCSADENGGAIYSASTASVNVAAFNDCSAKRGGAIYAGGTMEASDITSERGIASEGGLLYNTGTTALVTVYANDSKTDNGGVIYNTGNCLISSVNFYESRVTGNGGAVYNTGAFYYNGGMMSGNECEGLGGGIYNSETGMVKIQSGEIASGSAKFGGGVYSLGSFEMLGGAIGQNKGVPEMIIFGDFTMGGNAVGYREDVFGLVQKADGSYPTVKLDSVLTNKETQHIALYKQLSDGSFKEANASGVQVFKGTKEQTEAASALFKVVGGGAFPFEISSSGVMKRSFPTVFVIVAASVLVVGAAAAVAIVKLKKKKSKADTF